MKYFYFFLIFFWGIYSVQAQDLQNTLNSIVKKASDWSATHIEAGKEHDEFSSNSDQSTKMQDALSDKANEIAKQISNELGSLATQIDALANAGKLDNVVDLLDKNLNTDPYNIVCGLAPSLIETLGLGIARQAKTEKTAAGLLKILEKAEKFLSFYQGELNKLSGKLDGIGAKPAMRDAAQRLIANARVTAYERLITDSLASIGKSGQAEVVNFFIKKGLKHKSDKIRLGVVKAFAYYANADTNELLELLKKEKDPRVTTMAITAIGAQGKNTPEVKDALKKALGHKSDLVAASAADAAAQLKLYSLIPDMIAVMDKREGKIDEDLERALTQMTGETHHENAKVWEIRWKNFLSSKLVDGQAAQLPNVAKTENKEEKQGGSFSYYGITTSSKKMIFILDISGSMRAAAAEDEKVVSGESRVVTKEEKVEGTTKMDVAKKHLIRAIEKLDPKTTFNIIVYSNTFHQWNKEMVQASPASKKEAIMFIEKQEAKGATNIFDPLESAIQIAGRGAFDKHYDIACDTIFLLTDGSPNRGRVPNAEDIIKEVEKLNELGRITIHTIGIGPQQNSKFLRELAGKFNGQYEGRGTKAPR